MQIYITRNNQQTGPFEENEVLKMIKSGDLSTSDLAIRTGEEKWQKLGALYPDLDGPQMTPILADDPIAITPKKSRKGLMLGCGGFFIVGILIAGILGFLGFRNLKPADSLEDLPDTVKDFKLADRYPPKGNIWGTETTFFGLYSNELKTQSVMYMITVYSSDSEASNALIKGLADSCQTGETPMNFSFIGDGGEEVSRGATCAVPLYILKDNKLIALGGGGATVDVFIEFAENLPFNVGTKMKKVEDK